MKDPSRKVIYMLWLVVAVLVAGACVGGIMLVSKADSLTRSNLGYQHKIKSLTTEVHQAQFAAQATPTPTPSVSPTPSPSAMPAVSPVK